MTQRLYDAAKRVADAAPMSLDQRLAIAALTGAEGVRVEGTVRGENPGKDEQ